MKKLFFALAAMLFSFASFAQADVIYLHNGKTVTGTVAKVGEHTIVFKYMNEDVEQVLGKYAVDHIIFGKSGRQQDVTPKLHVYSEQDWENVMIVENPDDIAGLVRVDEIRGKTAFINMHTGAGSDNSALRKIKKEAAGRGCAFVLITSEKEIDRKSYQGGSLGQVQSIKRGVCYGY